MGVRDREKQPDVALVVVIDKSGSMDACHCNSFNGGMGGGSGTGGVRKVDIGKEAILRAASAMTARDELGVVAFDQAAHWIVKTAPLGTVTDLQGAIGGIQPDGQTNIFAGLDQAVQSLKTATATRRHIILLTDGWSSSGQYDDILKQMKAAGITLSTVGAGGGANPFLEQLAHNGGGRFYAANDPSNIPDIFLKETQQVSGQQIVEEKFFPIQTSSSPILRGIEGGLPSLLGYNGTTAKPAAQTVLVTARDDPLLAQWQYGLGRSVAWTSDSTGRWAKSWIGWQGFSQFFSQMVGWTFPGEESGGIEASFVDRGGRTFLRVESVAEDGSPRDFYATHVALVGPDLQPAAIDLSQIAPGVYETPVESLESGAYAVRVTQTKPGSPALGRTLGLVAPTAAEYRLLGANEPLLGAIRAATGGKEADTPAEVWVHDLRATNRYTDLWPLLLVLALLLWPLDIALRRVSVGRRELADARRWAGSVGRSRRVATRTRHVREHARGDGTIVGRPVRDPARGRRGGPGRRRAPRRPRARRTRPRRRRASAPTPCDAVPAPRRRPPPRHRRRRHRSPHRRPRRHRPPRHAPPAAPPAPPCARAGSGAPAEPTDTLARLREAKRRTRG